MEISVPFRDTVTSCPSTGDPVLSNNSISMSRSLPLSILWFRVGLPWESKAGSMNLISE